ncbi:MAG: winged helix-turn-helix transcriptional regulator [Alphaproteobacteria bacterium]|nr:winged helix-turn-helix transcriptional regulator [Alphaproteobacteria bacterium]
MTDPAPPLPFRIVNWIGIVEQLATAEANRVLRPLELPMPLFVLLNHFSHRPGEPKTVTGIARALQQPQPGVTKNVQKLVARGWLAEKDHGVDGRSKLLTITPAGLKCHRAAIETLMPGLAGAFTDWSEADLRKFFGFLDRLKLWLDGHR